MWAGSGDGEIGRGRKKPSHRVISGEDSALPCPLTQEAPGIHLLGRIFPPSRQGVRLPDSGPSHH